MSGIKDSKKDVHFDEFYAAHASNCFTYLNNYILDERGGRPSFEDEEEKYPGYKTNPLFEKTILRIIQKNMTTMPIEGLNRAFNYFNDFKVRHDKAGFDSLLYDDPQFQEARIQLADRLLSADENVWRQESHGTSRLVARVTGVVIYGEISKKLGYDSQDPDGHFMINLPQYRNELARIRQELGNG